jgi:hypothetical protein
LEDLHRRGIVHYVEGARALKVHNLILWMVHEGVDGEVTSLNASYISDSIFSDVSRQQLEELVERCYILVILETDTISVIVESDGFVSHAIKK